MSGAVRTGARYTVPRLISHSDDRTKIPPRNYSNRGRSRQSAFWRGGHSKTQGLNPEVRAPCFFDVSMSALSSQLEFSPINQKLFESFPLRIQRYDFFRYLSVVPLRRFSTSTPMFSSLPGYNELLGTGCVFSFRELTLADNLPLPYQNCIGMATTAFGAIRVSPVFS